VLYTTSAWSLVYAFDARTGQLLWMFDPHVAKDHANVRVLRCGQSRRRALTGGRVYVGALDGA